MLEKKVAELLNQQINKEFYSAYLYLDFANYYDGKRLAGGYANWYQCPGPGGAGSRDAVLPVSAQQQRSGDA